MKISIVIVTHNRLPALCELLESIARQSIKPYEVIIVNDAGEKVDFVQHLYSDLPIKALHLEENVKHVKARNIGVKEAAGDVIMLCDDDDFFTPCHMERMAKALETADFVYSDAEIVSFERKGDVRIPTSRHLFAYTFELEEMRKFSTYVPSGSMYKRSLHSEIGYFDPAVHNYWDWDFFLRAAERFHVKRVPAASVIYAFSAQGDNQSGDLGGKRQHYLDVLSEKHQLGKLPTKNFFVLLTEPAMRKREAESQIVWDGEPVISRLVSVSSV
ncbi:glycosyltransferase family 2 protein [Bacillus sonorensis]|uniref:Glycosyl transferase family protein n=2 Tax=Bacillus sonorensis TaxID=119858 RepID=M5PD92_9BACI|nr:MULTISPECIES: glycosyltransferase family 2 protein [Bacillus]TWK80801.1 PGL/p-HBAD biosynthesis glycosyltransferase [Bacillus paralicheniformis]ASB86928.1 putative glycosyltransferase YwdF [Bacillus sonorensis]EME73582.1 glycosyl transferase family protein [Bacillus sonorensis L12]MCZ0072607.1 glycosyltransferase family 2 protein [Bacillus sonorensis]MCZ0091228.1 glycosyltransferase family 2 protein [Bacillus sonorensis]